MKWKSTRKVSKMLTCTVEGMSLEQVDGLVRRLDLRDDVDVQEVHTMVRGRWGAVQVGDVVRVAGLGEVVVLDVGCLDARVLRVPLHVLRGSR